MAADFKVFTRKKDGTLVVRPPFDDTTPGGTVTVKNRTTCEIMVILPADFDVAPFPLHPTEEKDTPVPEDIDPGVYEFKVVELATLAFATASSDPEIIIE